MIHHSLDLNVVVVGSYSNYVTDDEIKEFIKFELQGGIISNENPFIDDGKDCEIKSIDNY